MSHFECRLNRHFWRSKSGTSCPKRAATFFREPFPNLENLLYLNAKNVDLSDIQNDSLSKILLK